MAEQHYLADYGWTYTATEVVDDVTVDLWRNRADNRCEVWSFPARTWAWETYLDRADALRAHLNRAQGGYAYGGHGELVYWDLPADPVARFREAERQGTLRQQERFGGTVDWDAEWYRERPMR